MGVVRACGARAPERPLVYARVVGAMSGRASVDEALTAEEEKAIVARLAALLPALGLAACVPRLPIKRKLRDNDYAPKHQSGTS